MKKALLALGIVFLLASCYMLDDIFDVSVSLNAPNEILIHNGARVSTLRVLEGEIIRAGETVHRLNLALELPAGERETIKIDDFVLQAGDTFLATDAVFSHEM